MTIPDNNHAYTPVAKAIPINDGGLGESFFSSPAETVSPDATAYLEVVSPSSLPEGYTFDAETNGHSFKVTVPIGGVEEGQRFSVPFPATSNDFSGQAVPRASVPVGHWKDGLCDCCRLGCVHPVIWNACCCPLILVGQVMHRLKLDWKGNEGSIAETAGTFRIMFLATIVYVVIDQFLKLFLPFFAMMSGSYNDEDYATLSFVRGFIGIAYFILTVVLVAKTRSHIRGKFSIPEKECKGSGMEDCICALCCTCCTVSQMARHTADYENYRSMCCSETGLGPNAPSIV